MHDDRADLRVTTRLLRSIKRQIREIQGPEDEEMVGYYRAYKDEIRRAHTAKSSMGALLRAALRTPVLLVGDFHTLDQAQKTYLRILDEIGRSKVRPILVLEMVHASEDTPLNLYVKGRIGDQEFLEQTRYFEKWGFDFAHYKAILDHARRWRLAVHGLNKGGHLAYRDRFMAHRIKHMKDRYPGQLIMVLVGDLHLASPHLPKELQKLGIGATVLFQNSETVYLRKLRAGADPFGWWSLGRGRFLVNNTPPTVKMQTALSWLEHGGEALCQLYGFCPRHSHSLDEVELSDTVRRYAEALQDLFGMARTSADDFQVFSLKSLAFLREPFYKRGQGRRYAAMIADGRSLYVARHKTIYIPVMDVNRTVQEAMHYLMNAVLPTTKSPSAFLRRIHYYACGYLASKLINPMRKTPSLEEMQGAIAAFAWVQREKDRMKLGRQIEIYRKTLDFMRLFGSPAPPLLLETHPMVDLDYATLYALSEQIGRTLGEGLYEKHDGGLLSAHDLRRYAFDQTDPLYLMQLDARGAA